MSSVFIFFIKRINSTDADAEYSMAVRGGGVVLVIIWAAEGNG